MDTPISELAKRWLALDRDEATRKEIQDLVNSNDEADASRKDHSGPSGPIWDEPEIVPVTAPTNDLSDTRSHDLQVEKTDQEVASMTSQQSKIMAQPSITEGNVKPEIQVTEGVVAGTDVIPTAEYANSEEVAEASLILDTTTAVNQDATLAPEAHGSLVNDSSETQSINLDYPSDGDQLILLSSTDEACFLEPEDLAVDHVVQEETDVELSTDVLKQTVDEVNVVSKAGLPAEVTEGVNSSTEPLGEPLFADGSAVDVQDGTGQNRFRTEAESVEPEEVSIRSQYFDQY